MSGIEVPFGYTSTAPAAAPDPSKGPVRATAYIVRLAKEDTSAAAVPLLDKGGNLLGSSLSRSDYCNAAVEGTVWVARQNRETRRFNYSALIKKRSADCSDIFKTINNQNEKGREKVANWGRIAFGPVRSTAPFGTGAATKGTACTAANRATFRLIPHRSIAVDKTIISIGSLVYLPALVGTPVTLPDGQAFTHDGFLLAVDTGSSIRGKHIDYFMGPSLNDHILPSIASDKKHPILLDLVHDPAILASLCLLHSSR